MANRSDVPLVDGRYDIDVTRPLAGAAGGLAAFVATDRLDARERLMAVRLGRRAPARAEMIGALGSLGLPGVLLPRAVGPHADETGKPAGWLICQAPPGPDLTAAHRWSEAEVIQCVLRPAAAVLVEFAARRVTHRAIRPNNLFRGGPGQPVTLGCAWASPPAFLQPCVFEPPNSAICAPAARGNGLIADDVYALGVLLLVLCLGHLPLAGLDDAAILERKRNFGSHVALTEGARVPQAILDLTRGMLADDPDHRPPPSLLLDPTQARARRVAARPPRRAQRAFELGGETVWNARALAGALGRHPEAAAGALRSNAVDRWLRHGLGDATQALRLDEMVHQRKQDAPGVDAIADATLVMRAIILLDPLAPLWWHGVALWPDALGPMLADGGYDAVVQELIQHEIVDAWAAMAPDRNDAVLLQIEGRRLRGLLRQRGASGGLGRLRYLLNPLLPCASPLLAEAWVSEPADLLPHLDALAARPARPAKGPIDAEIAAFLVTRLPHAAESELARLDELDPIAAARAQLRVLTLLQGLPGGTAVPALAAWFADLCRPALARWPNQRRVSDAEARLPAVVAAGRLSGLLALFDDPARDRQDAAALERVRERVLAIDRALQTLQAGKAGRHKTAQALGRQIAVGLGAVALTGVLALWVV